MSLTAFLLMAAATSAGPMLAQVGNGHFRINDDYPPKALAAREGALLFISLLIDQKGNPVRCRIVARSGSPDFEPLACRPFDLHQIYYKPARDSEGKRVFSIYDIRSVFKLSDQKTPEPLQLEPDFSFEANALPGHDDPSFRVIVATDIGPDGALLGCRPAAPVLDQALANQACDHLPTVWKPRKETDLRGNPIRYVRGIRVAFVKVAASSSP